MIKNKKFHCRLESRGNFFLRVYKAAETSEEKEQKRGKEFDHAIESERTGGERKRGREEKERKVNEPGEKL